MRRNLHRARRNDTGNDRQACGEDARLAQRRGRAVCGYPVRDAGANRHRQGRHHLRRTAAEGAGRGDFRHTALRGEGRARGKFTTDYTDLINN